MALALRNRLKEHYLGLLAAAYFCFWLLLDVNPLYPQDWLLENLLIFMAVPVIIASVRWFRLSDLSYTLIFIFLCLHTLGAHYTYAEVPYDRWMQALTGHSLSDLLGWQRNHYDRLVHFCYGLLLAYPIREIFMRFVDVRGFLTYFLPLDLTMSTSMLYELLEWGAAEIFGGDLGMAYLGTQGDVWDAHKDMALASLGALIAMLLTTFANYRRRINRSSDSLSAAPPAHP
jgi:putative membrane protein